MPTSRAAAPRKQAIPLLPSVMHTYPIAKPGPGRFRQDRLGTGVCVIELGRGILSQTIRDHSEHANGAKTPSPLAQGRHHSLAQRWPPGTSSLSCTATSKIPAAPKAHSMTVESQDQPSFLSFLMRVLTCTRLSSHGKRQRTAGSQNSSCSSSATLTAPLAPCAGVSHPYGGRTLVRTSLSRCLAEN